MQAWVSGGHCTVLVIVRSSPCDLVAEALGACEQGAGYDGVGDGAPFVYRLGEKSGWVAIQLSTVRRVTPKKRASSSLVAPSRQ